MEESLEKIQGTHILARRQILYRMMYETLRQKTYARTLLCVHLTKTGRDLYRVRKPPYTAAVYAP